MEIPDLAPIEFCGLSNDITAAVAKKLTFARLGRGEAFR